MISGLLCFVKERFKIFYTLGVSFTMQGLAVIIMGDLENDHEIELLDFLLVDQRPLG